MTYQPKPPTTYRVPAILRDNGSMLMRESYDFIVRTRSGNETHRARIGFARTHCGVRVASAVIAPAGPTCEKCATIRLPMTEAETLEVLEYVKTYGGGWRAKDQNAGRYVPAEERVKQ